jgi:hypothetical protein
MMWTHLRATLKKFTADPDGGYASEAVLVTALLIVCALVVIGIIVAKVTSKANTIDLGLLPLATVTATGTPAP